MFSKKSWTKCTQRCVHTRLEKTLFGLDATLCSNQVIWIRLKLRFRADNTRGQGSERTFQPLFPFHSNGHVAAKWTFPAMRFRPLDLPREASTLIFEHACYVKMQINFRGSLGQCGMQFIVLAFTLQSSFIPLSRAEASISTASVGPQMTCSHLTSCGSDDSEQDLHLTVTTETPVALEILSPRSWNGHIMSALQTLNVWINYYLSLIAESNSVTMHTVELTSCAHSSRFSHLHNSPELNFVVLTEWQRSCCLSCLEQVSTPALHLCLATYFNWS